MSNKELQQIIGIYYFQMRLLLIVAMGCLLAMTVQWCAKAQLSHGVASAVLAVDFSPDNKTMLSLSQDAVYFWNSAYQVFKYVNNTGSQSTDAKFSKNGLLIAIGYDNGRVFMLNNAYAYIYQINTGFSTVAEVDFSKDSTLLLVCGQGSFAVYTLGTPTPVVKAVGGTIRKCRMGPNNEVGTIVDPNKFQHWDNTYSTKLNEQTAGAGKKYTALDFTSSTLNTRAVVSCDDNKGYDYVVSTKTFTQVMTCPNNKQLLTTSYSKDGSCFLYAGQNDHTYIMNGSNFNNSFLQDFQGPTSSIISSAFSYDSNRMAVGTQDGQIFVYARQCQQNCSLGFYFLDPTCLPCPQSCLICSSATSCSLCSLNNYLVGSTCTACTLPCISCSSPTACTTCAVGYYYSATACLTCTSLWGTFCTACNALKCFNCLSQTYLSVGNQCLSCTLIPNCIRCSTSTFCLQCLPKFTPVAGVCTACPTNCLICLTSTLCTKCTIGYYLSTNVCTPCISPCIDCASALVCLQCPIAAYLKLDKTCANCTLPCLHCNVLGCLSCSFGYYLSAVSCLRCPPQCLSCTNTTYCTTCSLRYYLQNNSMINSTAVCLTCPTPHCLDCTPTCTACLPTFYLKPADSLCYPCPNQCSHCNVTTCYTCSVGYYLSSGSCTTCSLGCATCTSALCFDCLPTYYLSAGTCLRCSGGCPTCTALLCTSCTLGLYLTAAGTCTRCPNRCIECALVSTVLTCRSCQVGTYLATNLCTQCTNACATCTNAGCTYCHSGYYLAANACTPCPTNCTLCNGSVCYACATGLQLIGNVCTRCTPPCIDCNGSACFTCTQGHYLNANTCLNCMNQCQSCTSATLCTLCVFGRYFDGTACSTCNIIQGCVECTTPTACVQCAAGYYATAGLCTYCPIKCDTCTVTGCTTCAALYYNSSTDCLPCANGCEQCNSPTNCLSCVSGRYLNNSLCSLCSYPCAVCSNLTSCYICNGGYYLTAGLCVDCALGCQNCNSSLVCTMCEDGYYLQTNICRLCRTDIIGCLTCSTPTVCGECLTGYYKSGSSCVLCATTRLGCTLCTTLNCLLCSSGFYLQSGSCMPCVAQGCDLCTNALCLSCTATYYMNAGVCLTCINNGCIQCSTATLCLSCDSNHYLTNSTCTLCSASIVGCTKCTDTLQCTQCAPLYHINAGVCIECLSGCTLCNSSSVCVSCDAGYYLTNSTCSTCSTFQGCLLCTNATVCLSCSEQYYASAGICHPCNTLPHCYSCLTSTLCVICSNGYKLNPNTQCQLISYEVGALEVFANLHITTQYINESILLHTLLVQDKQFTHIPTDNLSSKVSLSLYNYTSNADIVLTIVQVEWGTLPNTLLFYTHNPLNISEITSEVLHTRLLQTNLDYTIPYKTKFEMDQDTLHSILPDLLPTSLLALSIDLNNPSFLQSVSASLPTSSFHIVGWTTCAFLFLFFLLKSTCFHPQSPQQGSLIPHILSLKVCALLLFPVSRNLQSFCQGFLSADLPYLTPFYQPYLTNVADNTVLGYSLFFSNMNFASMYLIPFTLFTTLFLIGKCCFPTKQGFITFLLNYFGFGICFAGVSSLVGLTLNSFPSFSLNALFYTLGLLIYIAYALHALLHTTSSLHNTILRLTPLRTLIKGTLLGFSYVAPLYIVVVCVVLDIGVAVAEFRTMKECSKWPWLINQILINCSLATLILLARLDFVIIFTACILGLVLITEVFLQCLEDKTTAKQLQVADSLSIPEEFASVHFTIKEEELNHKHYIEEYERSTAYMNTKGSFKDSQGDNIFEATRKRLEKRKNKSNRKV